METNDNLNAFPKSEFMICTCACKGVLTWYRYDFHTGTTFTQVKLSYRYEFHTGTIFIPVRHSYRYDFHTSTTFIPVRLSYWYDFHTGTTFIPVRLSYRYDFHTGTTFIPVRLSYRYDFHTSTSTTRLLLWPSCGPIRCMTSVTVYILVALVDLFVHINKKEIMMEIKFLN